MRLAWLDQQWLEPPTRQENYLMQIAAELEILRSRKDVAIASKEIPFKVIKPKIIDHEVEPPTREQRIAQFLGTWMPLVTKNRKKK